LNENSFSTDRAKVTSDVIDPYKKTNVGKLTPTAWERRQTHAVKQ
jgi:hypothetical protein